MHFSQATIVAVAALLSSASAMPQLNIGQGYQDYVQHCADVTSDATSGAQCCSQAYTTCVDKSSGDVSNCMDLQNQCKALTGAVAKRQLNMAQGEKDYVQHCQNIATNANDLSSCCSQAYTTCVSASGGDIANCGDLQTQCKSKTFAKRQLNMAQAEKDYVQHCQNIATNANDLSSCCSQAYTTCVSTSGGDIANCGDLQTQCKSKTFAKRQLNLQQAYQDYVQHCVDITSTKADGAACCGQAYTSCVDESSGDIANCGDLQSQCKTLTGN